MTRWWPETEARSSTQRPSRSIGAGSFPCSVQTGQRVCGPFLAYWLSHGGLTQQGLPLTGAILETNPTNGLTYPTQCFERARFEHHYEFLGTPNDVIPGPLGREQFPTKYPNGVPSGSPRP